MRVICRDVQRDVVKDLPTHLDLMRLRRTTKINLFIPVEFVGEDDCPGIRKGGVLTVIRNEIEHLVTAGDIPEKVTVSLDGLDVGDNVTISQVELPEGSKPTIDRDFVICNIYAPSALKSSDDVSEDEDEAAEAATDEAPAEEGGEEQSDVSLSRLQTRGSNALAFCFLPASHFMAFPCKFRYGHCEFRHDQRQRQWLCYYLLVWVTPARNTQETGII